MIYLLDTDTLIYVVRGLKITAPQNERQRERLQVARRIVARCRNRQEAGDDVGLSAITVAELEYGARRSGDYAKEITAVRKILTPFVRYDFDAALCAEHYGEGRPSRHLSRTRPGNARLAERPRFVPHARPRGRRCAAPHRVHRQPAGL